MKESGFNYAKTLLGRRTENISAVGVFGLRAVILKRRISQLRGSFKARGARSMSRTRQLKGAIPILLDLKSCVWQLKSQTVLTVTLVLVLLAALLSGVAPAFADNGNTQTQAPVITSAGPFTVDEGETAVGNAYGERRGQRGGGSCLVNSHGVRRRGGRGQVHLERVRRTRLQCGKGLRGAGTYEVTVAVTDGEGGCSIASSGRQGNGPWGAVFNLLLAFSVLLLVSRRSRTKPGWI